MIKKFLILLYFICLSKCFVFANEIVLPNESLLINKTNNNYINKLAIKDVSAEESAYKKSINDLSNRNYTFYDTVSQTIQNIYNLQIENTNVPSSLLKDELTFEFENGPLQTFHPWAAIQMNNAINFPENGSVNDKFNVNLINIFLDGTFKGNKERFRIMFDPTPSDKGLFRTFLQDCYIESSRIPHHKILIGNSRPGVGYEGTQSSFTLPFAIRSQISRNFGTVRKKGIRIKGNYKYVDYDLGGYSSDTYWTEFFPGVEFNGWINFKPLANTNGKYGNLVLGGGVVNGQNHSTNFFVGSGYIGYDYNKFWTKMEYAIANGSNGSSGLTDKHRQGWHVTAGYHITPKWEILARYDEFDPDRTICANNQREYTLGVNYYIKGQALRLILNYVFCQNEAAPNSHRIVLGTQIAI